MIHTLDDAIVFLKRFHRHRLEDPSWNTELLDGDLPPGLCQVYRNLGGFLELDEEAGSNPLGAQNVLAHPSDLLRVDGMVEFAFENQGNWSCRCALGEEDPAVYSDATEYWSHPRPGFNLVSQSLNRFLITFCLTEAIFSCEELIVVQDLAAVESLCLKALWLDAPYVFEEPFPGFYTSEDETVLMADFGADIRIGRRRYSVNSSRSRILQTTPSA